MVYDVIIIGLGPAGISAAIYAKRSGLSVLCFEKELTGGLVNYTYEVDNYPGFNKINGPELANKMAEHLKSFDVEIKNEEVKDVIDGNVKKVITNKGEYTSKYVIIATGRKRRTLGLPLEDKYSGKGISYCALCDGNFYRNKKVVVLGSGDSAYEESLYLSKVTDGVTLLIRGEKPKANAELVSRVESNPNIEVRFNSAVAEILEHDDKFAGVKLSSGEEVLVDGLFVYVGFVPSLDFVPSLNLETVDGYIKTDSNYETSIKGIYAIGDVIKKDLYQIISAEYEGALAASHIARN